MKKKLNTTLLLLLLPFLVWAQEITITGTVTEAGTGEPLAGVNVYIAGSSIGASTDPDGFYEFKTALKGRFNLIASFLGFKSSNRELIIIGDRGFSVDFALEENTLLMDEVEVAASRDTEWQENYDDFRRFFIGWDEYADMVKIENPEMIDFRKLSPTQVAVTFREPIRIQNLALGYRIVIIDDKIIFNPIEHTGFWNVYPRFEEMTSENRRVRRNWNSNRSKVYEGSSRHFFVSLIDDNLRNNKFEVNPSQKVMEPVTNEEEIRNSFPRSFRMINENYHVFRMKNYNFGVVHDPALDRAGNILPGNEYSSFEIQNFSSLLVVDNYGNLFNPEEVIFYGPWGRDRFAKTLPTDYKD